MSRILLVEDDAALARGLVALLKHNGYEVESVATGQAALAHHAVGAYAAIILDLSLPDMSGLDVLKQVRSGEARIRSDSARCPVLILTARSALNDRVQGLDLGADDYLLKPFEPQELLARLRALLRRSQGDPSPSITVGLLTLEHSNGAFRLGDDLLELPRRERAVLEQLVIRAGKIVLRENLANMVFGLDDDVGANALEVYIGRLRKRLAAGGPHIRTVRGLGYMLEQT
jgi:two-component system, OmpR family, response regulator TctD